MDQSININGSLNDMIEYHYLGK